MRVNRAKQKRAQQRRDEWNAAMRERVIPIFESPTYFARAERHARERMAAFDRLSPEQRQIQRKHG